MALLSGSLLVPYAVLVAFAQGARDTVDNVDFWTLIEIGRRLSLADARTLVHGFYPLGYPFLLRLAIEAGIDVLRAGHFLSLLAGALALGATVALAWQVTRRPLFAWVAGALLVLHRLFLIHAGMEGNDMTAASLQLLALALLWPVAPEQDARAALRRTAAAGAALGLAYLMRHTALVLLPVALLFVAWRAGGARRAAGLAAALLGAFAIVTAVQTVPSLIVHGQPFYSLQAKIAWYNVFGPQDAEVGWPLSGWRAAPEDISLAEVLALDPGRVLAHWWFQVSSVFTAGLPPHLNLMWTRALHFAWVLGLVLVWFDRRHRLAQRALLVLAFLAPVASTALAMIAPRYILVSLCLEAVLIAWVAERATAWLEWGVARAAAMWPAPWRRFAASGAVLLVLVYLVKPVQQAELIGMWLGRPVPSSPREATAVLRAAGMGDPRTALTNDVHFHATDAVARTRFTPAWFFAPQPASVAELLGTDAVAQWLSPELLPPPVDVRWQYLAFNYGDGGVGKYEAIRATAVREKGTLVPLQLGPEIHLFCILPCEFAGTVTDDVTILGGLRLAGHRLFAAPGAAGVYLYWENDQVLEVPYRIGVRLLDAGGRVLSEVQGEPQLGTYATNAWPAGAHVTDFYYFPEVDCSGGCRAEVTVYAPGAGEALSEPVVVGP